MPRLSILKTHPAAMEPGRASAGNLYGLFPDGGALMSVDTGMDIGRFQLCKNRWLRTSPDWSKGEVALMASYVSRLNDCHL